MNCEKTLILIDDLIEGELDEQTAAQVESHIFACVKCREQNEMRKREKAIYAQYLFDAEPPTDLWRNFQAKLESDKGKTTRFAERPAREANHGRTNVFGFLRFSPLLAGAVLLIVFGVGFGWLKFAPNQADVNNYVAKKEFDDSQSAAKSGETDKNRTANLPAEIKSSGNNVAPQNSKIAGKSESTKAKSVFAAAEKTLIAGVVKVRRKTVSPGVKKNSADENEPNEERLRSLRMVNLEKEIAGQIEKIEMLLRSFRNARAVETIETFDVGYEKGQARKLLEKNARLRLEAENNGIGYAEELLSRVEPYLLDIANLEDKPAPGKVLDIKERVSSQNIIASLQVY